MSTSDVYTERTNLRTSLISGIAAVIGIVLIVLAENVTWLKIRPGYQTVVRELGGLLFASVAIALLWELGAKRAFLSELMAKAKLGEEVRAAGLVSVTNNFPHIVDWSKLFKRVHKLDIFFAYASTWRKNNAEELRSLAQRTDVRVRIIIPDPDDDLLMTDLGRRFGMNTDKVKEKVQEAANEFLEIFTNQAGSVKGAKFELWYVSAPPVFSFYRFDHLIVFASYRHRIGRGSVPTFVIEQGGSLYEFVMDELQGFFDPEQDLARRVFPTQPIRQ